MSRQTIRFHLFAIVALACALADAPASAFASQCSWPNVWSFRSGNGPSARSVPATAYDAARDELVVFGGSNGTVNLNETWVLRGGVWGQKFPANSPSPRSGAGMVYDSARQVLVMHGGFDGTTRPGDTWEWDGTNWTQTVAAGAGPPYSGFGMAYSVAAATTVLYGGASASGRSSDTWEYTSGTWSLVSNSSPPSFRSNLAMVYSAANNLVYMFGGQAPGSAELNDLWTYDASTNTWTPVAGAGPSARQNHRMTYDSTCGGIYLFGGEKDGTWYDDLWKYDGGWSLASAGSACGARELGSLEHIPGARTMILFGGRGTGATLLDSTWEYGCQIWDRNLVDLSATWVDSTHVLVQVLASCLNVSPLAQDMGFTIELSVNGSPVGYFGVDVTTPGGGGGGGGGTCAICDIPCAVQPGFPMWCVDAGYLPWWSSFSSGCSCANWFMPNPWESYVPAMAGDQFVATLLPDVQSVGESYPDNDSATFTIGSPVGVPSTEPAVDKLQVAVQPNPALDRATVALSLARSGRCSVALFSVSGQRLRSIVEEDLTAGDHEFDFDLKDGAESPLAAGVYFIRAESGGVQEVRQVTVTR